MSLTCGNFAGKSSYALVVLLTLATVQRAETAGVPRQGLQRHDERQGRRQAHRSKRFAPTVVMFESRDLRDPESYWRAAYALAAAHAAEQGHNFVFYQLPKDTNTLEACDGAPLGPFWGKVAAAVQATFDFPESRFFLLLDSDAAISAAGRPGRRWADRPLAAGLAAAAGWPGHAAAGRGAPVLANQDGPGWWSAAWKSNSGRPTPSTRRARFPHRWSKIAPAAQTGWHHLLNSGTLAWRGRRGREFVAAWWRETASNETLGANSFGHNFQKVWPQEQYALNALANAPRWSDAVAFTPEPGQYVGSAQPPARNEVPCLSHVPKKMCVVAHHCSHKKEKEELVALARDLGLLRDATTFPHRRELPARGGFRSACSPELPHE